MQTHKLKPFKILDCSNLNDIQSECLSAITNKIKNWQGNPWVDTNDLTPYFYKNCPSLKIWLKNNNWKIKTTAVTYLDGTENRNHIPVHIDKLPVLTRINIPIKNCNQAIVNLFEISEDYRNKINLITDTYYSLDQTQCVKIGQYILNSPIVFNTQVAHSVEPISNAKYPRIMLTLTLFNDILDYLK